MSNTVKKLVKHADHRGWLIEAIKRKDIALPGFGQFFVATLNPKKFRGNHYHLRKREWFCVVEGVAELILEHIKTKKQKKVKMSDKEPVTVGIAPNYAHAIRNTGKKKAVFLVYVNEELDKKDPDTFFYEIIKA